MSEKPMESNEALLIKFAMAYSELRSMERRPVDKSDIHKKRERVSELRAIVLGRMK